MTDCADFACLLKEFQGIPRSPRSAPTFMEISGYPHLENVCSNILRFFLDADECHGMGDLLLRALFLGLGRDVEGVGFRDVTVERECSTDRGDRIDLVVETDRYLIGIENKLFHGIANDLDHYAGHLRRRAADIGGKEVILILLTLLPVDETVCGPFQRITYERWFAQVDDILGDHAQGCDQRYLLYLLDFVHTVRGLVKRPEMNPELLVFLADNWETIRDLNNQVRTLRDELKRQQEDVAALVQLDESSGIKPWTWGGDTDWPWPSFGYDIPFLGDGKIVVDAFLTSCWVIEIHTRQKSPEEFRRWLAERGIHTQREQDGRLICAEFSYGTPLIKVAECLSGLLVTLSSEDGV
ncbi:MAG TPA: PD-(D/E)XK nuclease family protein [Chloroflexota bacterium]|nr:PD-(D/E)XK nuclease family protein [Chloroflexota bacterium]